MREVKRAKKIPEFDCIDAPIAVPTPVCKLVCGGMHTLALATSGAVYSWGCNDEGALGRSGPEDRPHPIEGLLHTRITDFTAGDSHSVFYNTQESFAYLCGLYRVSIQQPFNT